jgi:hypothetical protein
MPVHQIFLVSAPIISRNSVLGFSKKTHVLLSSSSSSVFWYTSTLICLFSDNFAGTLYKVVAYAEWIILS